MDTKNLHIAAYNNAAWCDIVCRSHNVPGEFHQTFWVNRHQTPLYYPNLVTLSPTENLNLHQNALATLLTARRDHTISVKDSFANLDLTPFGFHQLFQAQWLFRSASADRSRQGTADLQWKRIESEKELLRWEEAWSQTILPFNRLFLSVLLHNADVCIVAAYREKQILAGAIANRTAEAVGLSNVFTPKREAERYWEELLDVITACYPGLPIVGYEQDENLTRALHVGFTPLGPLRIWMKEVINSRLSSRTHEQGSKKRTNPLRETGASLISVYRRLPRVRPLRSYAQGHPAERYSWQPVGPPSKEAYRRYQQYPKRQEGVQAVGYLPDQR